MINSNFKKIFQHLYLKFSDEMSVDEIITNARDYAMLLRKYPELRVVVHKQKVPNEKGGIVLKINSCKKEKPNIQMCLFPTTNHRK